MGRRNQVAASTQRYLKRKTEAEWRTALYARLSNENNGLEDDRSLQNQIKYLEEYTGRHPELLLVDRYVDNGQSGMSFKRAGFIRMMEDVRDGKINCIVVKDLSRFGRNHIEAGYYLETIFPQLDVRFISVNDNFDSMAEGKKDGIMVPLKNMINEMYAKDTQRKILATLRAKEKKGERGLGSAPYGYLKSPDCCYRYVPDPKTRGFVTRMFQWASTGITCKTIADRLERMGAVTPMGRRHELGQNLSYRDSGRWDNRTIRQMLRNPVYMGTTVYNRDGESKGERMEFSGTHEALIDEDTFYRTLEKLDERSKKKRDEIAAFADFREAHPNILKDVFYCAECGHTMLYKRRGVGRSARFAKYSCSGYNHYRKDDPKAPICGRKEAAITEQAVYRFVLSQIRRQLRAGFEVEELERLTGADERARKKRLDLLKDREAGQKQRMERLYEDYVDKTITVEEYTQLREICEEKRKRLKEQIAAEERGDGRKDSWKKLKEELFGSRITESGEAGKETAAMIRLTDTSSVEIVEEDEPDMVERLLRRGLTGELVQLLVERLEYSVDGKLSIRFKCEDYAEKLEKKRQEWNAADSEHRKPKGGEQIRNTGSQRKGRKGD